jgi:hypothetical protein
LISVNTQRGSGGALGVAGNAGLAKQLRLFLLPKRFLLSFVGFVGLVFVVSA